ncbi:unnamed protein product [Trichobilharzia regenti]|nr:unnamed protein product [Trichobilharzia regenti]
METIGRSIHSNNAIAKQAAQRFAEKVFHDCNSGAAHNNVINHCEAGAHRQKEKKTYAVLRKAGSKELSIAAKNWMPSDDMCSYHSSVTDSEVEACIRPRQEWLLIDCQMLAELGNCFRINCIPVIRLFRRSQEYFGGCQTNTQYTV